MNTLVIAVFAAMIAASYAATEECHLDDCRKTYAASTKATCEAVADWKKCVDSQTTEQSGLCNLVGINAAKAVVKAAEFTQGCSSASGINASILGSLLVACIAVFFRS